MKLRSPYVARTSFAATTMTAAAGRYWAAQGIKTAVTLGPDDAAGHQMIAGFKQGFEEAGGKVNEELWSAFRQTRDWGPLLTKARQSGAQIIYGFYGGSESVQTVRQHAEFGMQKTMPLRGNMWLFDETLWNAIGDSVVGATYDTINIPDLPHEANKKFVAAFKKKFGMDPDINAVLGYENMKPLLMAIDKLKGDTSDGAKVLKTMSSLEWDSTARQVQDGPEEQQRHPHRRLYRPCREGCRRQAQAGPGCQDGGPAGAERQVQDAELRSPSSSGGPPARSPAVRIVRNT